LALAIGLVWWGEASPDAQLMSRENLCCGVAVLWCCRCGGVVSAVGAVGAGRLGFLGRPVFTCKTLLYCSFGCCWLDTYGHAFGDLLLAC
jgi:hypothetical protein